jgi:hypothetical protein
MVMSIDKSKIKTQDELDEPAPIDQVEERVDAEMKKLEGVAKRDVAEGLKNEDLAREGDRQAKEGERRLKKARRD